MGERPKPPAGYTWLEWGLEAIESAYVRHHADAELAELRAHLAALREVAKTGQVAGKALWDASHATPMTPEAEALQSAFDDATVAHETALAAARACGAMPGEGGA